MNPVLAYRAKAAQDAARHEIRIQLLRKEGLSDAEIEDMLNGAGGTAHNTGAKRGAWKIFVDMGIRTTAVRNGESAEQAALDNLRRQRKNVEVYLSKDLGIDTRMIKSDVHQRRVEDKDKQITAAEKAMDTELNRYDDKRERLHALEVVMAQRGRKRLVAENQRLVNSGKLRARDADDEMERGDSKVAFQLDDPQGDGLSIDRTPSKHSAVSDPDEESDEDIEDELDVQDGGAGNDGQHKREDRTDDFQADATPR